MRILYLTFIYSLDTLDLNYQNSLFIVEALSEEKNARLV